MKKFITVKDGNIEVHPAVAYTVFAVSLPYLLFVYPQLALGLASILLFTQTAVALWVIYTTPMTTPATPEEARDWIDSHSPEKWAAVQATVDALAARMGVAGEVKVVPDITKANGFLGALRYSDTYSEVYASDLLFTVPDTAKEWALAHELAHLQHPYRKWLAGFPLTGALDYMKEPLAMLFTVLPLAFFVFTFDLSGWAAVGAGVASLLIGFVGTLGLVWVTGWLSRREERRADTEAMLTCGPGSITQMQVLLALESASESRIDRFSRSHPYPHERLAHARNLFRGQNA